MERPPSALHGRYEQRLSATLSRASATVRAGHMRAYTLAVRGLPVFETRLMVPSRRQGRPIQAHRQTVQMIAVFEGELHVRRRGRELTVTAGSAIVESSSDWDERWEGDAFNLLAIEWEPERATNAPPDVARLSPIERAHLQRLVGGVSAVTQPGEADALVTQLNAVLPIAAAPSVDPPPPGTQPILSALFDALSHLDRRPMWSDLEAQLGLGDRQLRRLIRARDRWLWLGDSGFREFLRLHRCLAAAHYLSRRDMSCDAIARGLGYGSTRALTLALHQEGMLGPSDLRRSLRQA